METEYLHNFVILAATGNFSEAADSLFISQSTLSKRINKLENTLGVTLFSRTTKHVELNEYGIVFLEYAKHMLLLQEQCLNEIKSMLPYAQSTIKIGSIPSMANYGITDLVSEFIRTRNIPVQVTTGQSGKLEKMLLHNQCDFAFIRQVHDPDNQLVKKKFTSDNLVAVLPKGHPLSEHSPASITQLKKEAFVLQPVNSRPYNYCIAICKKFGFTPNVIFTDSQIDNIVDFVAKGLGVSLLMEKLVTYLENDKVQIVQITPTISTDITLCYNRNLLLSGEHKQFVNFVKEKSTM
ncbi:LysR family transcriptional regulator [Paenibacillus pinistramenti]|uniref:LysR family transcriptional regulator n=1 Tax=Paenibacillus pinistramenti TaxID=1768003 RepID=UPI001108E2D3|nr:LysR family transcriptional regulator [Paenibacillus pinistramenti]